MPGQEVVVVELRKPFVRDALRRVGPVAELCAAYGISRKTGYKFLARYDTLGPAGLADQSRRPTAPQPPLIRCCSSACSRSTTAIRTGGPGNCSAS
jgi:hypothetical protein